MRSSLLLRTPDPAEYPALLALWERSVRATHHFLTPEDVDFFRPLVLEAFPQVDLTVAYASEGRPVGFMGLHGSAPDKVEMLFVDPPFFRQGVGRLLLDQAVAEGAAQLDVNEQNPGALAFYQVFGFQVTGRSALDSTGRPFPLLHLRLASTGKAG